MAKKDKAARLPKKVGGVKLPKQLRKSAGVVVELAQDPVVREVVSAAVVAGASALAKRKLKGAASGGSKPARDLDGLLAQGKDIGAILADGVSAFVGALLSPPKDGDPEAGKPGSAPGSQSAPSAGEGAAVSGKKGKA